MHNSPFITRDSHAHLRWLRCDNYARAASEAIVSLTAEELPAVARFAPIAFVLREDAYIPVAIMGLQVGSCLFVTADGQWSSDYIPAAIRTYPFHLAPSQDGARVCIHDDYCLSGEAGERFFGEDGLPSPAFQRIVDELASLARGRLAAQLASSMLGKHQLIKPWQLSLKTAAGERQLPGFFTVDEAALQQLSGDAMVALRESGALKLAYAQLLSVPNFARLGELEQARNRALAVANPRRAPQQADATVVSPAADRILLVTFQWSTLVELPYLVRQAGFQVDVLCPGNNRITGSGFYDRWIDSGPSMESLLAALAELSQGQQYRHIVIGDDPILWKIYRENFTELWHLLPILNPLALPILNKLGFSRHCRAHQIPGPDFCAIGSQADADPALRMLGLPIVLKENYSNGGAGVHICRDAEAYLGFIASYDFREPLLAQQFIQGELLGVEAIFKQGKLLDYCCSIEVDPTLGPSTKRRYLPNEDAIGEVVSRFGLSAKLHGFVNMSLIQEGASQAYFLIEADPRPNKWVSYARWFGHDFAPAFKILVADDDGSEVLPSAKEREAQVDCWEVEHFPTHFGKLLNAGKLRDACIHLLNFKLTHRYTVYDPVLLENKMNSVFEQLKPK